MDNTVKGVEIDPVKEKLIELCFHEFCTLAGDSPCGCDGCPYGQYGSENGECYEAYKKQKLAKACVTVQKWIPVSEELPEQYEVVIGWTIFKEMGEVEHDGKKFVWADEESVTAFVTHWMPLPEPPKEG